MRILINNALIISADDTFRGSIAIDGNVITHVGSVPKGFAADTVIDGSGFIAMPGLVNAHAHSPMGLLRNYADDLPFADWLFGKIIPAEGKLTEDDVYWGALLGIAEMLKSGVTCFADMYLHMDAVAAAVAETGIRANLSYGPITSAARGNGLIVDKDKCSAFVKKWDGVNGGLIKSYVEVHSVYLFDRPSITEAAALARDLETGIHIHLSESASEMSMSAEKYGITPIEAAYDMGVLDVPVIAAHCVRLNERDIEILKEKRVSPVHCPTSNLKLANGIAPVPRLLAEGVNVCLGTDGAASNNNLNMLEEMHVASLIHKGHNQNPECMPAGSVIEMASANGARALGFADTGKIAPGYKADIVLIDSNKPHMRPSGDAKATLVYSAQAADVDTVIVDGKILVKGGRLTGMDEESIMCKAEEIADRIRK